MKFGEPDDLIIDASECQALGRTAAARRAAYRHLFASPLSEELRYRRPDLVHGPFVGDEEWVKVLLRNCGLSPPD